VSSSLRIGITCYPTFGGSGIIASEIGQSLARRGHEVHVIASSAPSRLDLSAERVFFHRVAVKDYPLFDHSPYALALAAKMVEVTTDARLDLLHVHYAVPHATSAYLARQILGAAAPRLITTLHGTDITLVGNDPSFLPITRFSMLKSDRLTVPSQFLARATRENFDLPTDTAIEVIPNFVDTSYWRPPEPRRWSAFAPLFGEAAAPVLVHSSNFRVIKRVDDVVRIFARVRAQRPVFLLLIGDGPERQAIETLAAELGVAAAVRFVGARRDFVDLLAQADVFLMPSGSESFGLAALEAQSCGLPVVATRVGGVEEVIEDGETGMLAPLGAIDEMAADVLSLLEDHARHARMAAAARARAMLIFEREPVVDRYQALYARVLTDRR
jgi:N-acetyl-alpha-D-glucosaminyl L-malate synthase BshA